MWILLLACGEATTQPGHRPEAPMDSGEDSGVHEDTGRSGDTGPVDCAALAGATLFASTCATCHGADGDSGFATDLSEAVPRLDTAALTSLLQTGKNYMPAPDLDASERDLVVAYIECTFGGVR